MSIELCDKSGSLGQVSTNTGYKEMIDAIEKRFDDGDHLLVSNFLNYGKTKNPQAVAKELGSVLKAMKDSEVRSTISHLIQLLNKAEDFAVIQ